MQDSGFKIQNSKFKIQGSRFKVQDYRFKVGIFLLTTKSTKYALRTQRVFYEAVSRKKILHVVCI